MSSAPHTAGRAPPTGSEARFLRVRLQAPATGLSELGDFYGGRLGLEPRSDGQDLFTCAIGETLLEFVPTAGWPFYHFALLVPGDRFDAAYRWAGERTELLPQASSGGRVFEFSSWNAHACYFHDPAGNIVELIAHRGLGERGASGPFSSSELIGLSELGLVGDPAPMAALLAQDLELEVWSGSAAEPGGLAFVGEKARTLILSPPGRGWLPTGRTAEVHALDAVLSGPADRATSLEGSHYRIRRHIDRAAKLPTH